MGVDLAIQSWVLANTFPHDRVMVWEEPESYLYGQAAMSLWGFNSVSHTLEIGEWERANLTNLDPSVVALYGNSMGGSGDSRKSCHLPCVYPILYARTSLHCGHVRSSGQVMAANYSRAS